MTEDGLYVKILQWISTKGKINTETAEGVMFVIPEGGRKRFKVRKREKKFKDWLGKKKLTKQYPERGAYTYSVYCGKAGDFAEGNSAPVMILEPPDPPPPDTPAGRRGTIGDDE